jgi:hypothetical protein
VMVTKIQPLHMRSSFLVNPEAHIIHVPCNLM